ncbi:IclR family transcriptional regulator [Jannaschia sp. W003]|uniref:IclR family transcriptional regulator n=1 Tax=Jannaschia sp. W003 TaxID=2867012 RepID=UPI0021A3A3D8|nr:IclR family transcriptional regulator [Jannaschia sp. W003]UWQ22626.1 IclR family transcriptional regulator [Jannaschia sp. W003]
MNVQRGEGSAEGTVGKALDVLERVAAFGRPVRFAELLDGSPYPKATLYRLVQTLARQRMLRHDPETNAYAPGLRLVRMAHAAWDQSSLAPVARPHLDSLSEAVGETVHLAQLDGGSVLYVDKRNAARPVEMFSAAGKVGPAHCTGVGKAMMAWLAEERLEAVLGQQSWYAHTPATITSEGAMRAELEAIRRAGHAEDREEHEPGIVCVALPVLSPEGRVRGAVSVTAHGGRAALVGLRAHLPALRRAVDSIAGELRAWRFPDQREDRE